jgi:hypothetical protein
MVLAVFVARAALEEGTPRLRKCILLATLAIAAANPLCEVYRHLREIGRRGALVMVPDESEVRSLWQESCYIRDRQSGNDYFFRQYVGSPESLFFSYLARPTVPADANRQRR